MIKSYFDPIWPAYDGRKHIPEEETIAKLAEKLINDDELVWHAKRQHLNPPTPNKSARVNARRRVGQGYWVDIRGSVEFFDEVAKFAKRLQFAGWHNI